MSILVTHPNRQHSHRAALALHDAGLLAGYWAGAPSRAEHASWVPRRWWHRFVRYAPLPLPLEKTVWAPLAPAVRRLSEAVLPSSAAAACDFWACRHFDRWAARRLARASTARGVLACEISALATFGAAKRRGWLSLLDAPSFHHAAQDRLHGFGEPPALHRRIVAVKDLELAAADHVITVSELARSTYVDAGIPHAQVHAVPLGADLDLFHPGREDHRHGPVTFAFSGASIRRKGFDLLVQAFARVLGGGANARLLVIGPRGDLANLVDASLARACTFTGPLPQAEVARLLRQADCLVLPSRNDSFGMAVAEALASGLAVIVSDMVGAKDLVRPGESGWIVPHEDVAALTERMLWAAGHAAEVRAMAAVCRRAAEAASWTSYRRRFTALVTDLLAECA